MPHALASDGLLIDHFPAAQRSLRIAFVSETYPPEVNGVATTVARIVQGMHARHHEVQLIRPRQDRLDAAARQARYDEVLLRSLPIPRYPDLRMGVPSKRALVQLWSRRRPDVVHIATEGALGWSALQAALHLKLPVCSDFRTNFHAYSTHYGLGWLRKPIMGYLRKFHNRCACTMVPTDALRRELQADGFQKLTVVSRGVDTELFHPSRRSAALRESWGLNEQDLLVGYVGRLAQEKNLGTLLTAFEALRRDMPRALLLLVGDGPMRAELQARCPDALFAGQRRGEDLAAHYASVDLFLFPSLTETFGNVTTEAMASGLPLVAFDHAAAAQLVHSGHNGLLAAAGDVDAFVAASRLLAGDAEQRQRLGRAAFATAQALGWDGVLARFEGVLHGVITAAERSAEAEFGGLARPAA
ncbi:glycosyltransferase [Xylophilus rhododendri]|uniref:Glycosyltransferase n=1 Tax=Xylophilus rhododendri TaxID=2697032 RepID=A0A857J7U1_9BURK|nr:glycosyltransferase family 1 protein [Xylophilus rhododendri]QHJ00035.1 glycosyltransferase [Xylophilus rhododendri]